MKLMSNCISRLFGLQKNEKEKRSLRRFAEADWGEMDEEDKETNNNALETGSRLFGSYECAHAKIWIITEADRSCTTILFPSEY